MNAHWEEVNSGWSPDEETSHFGSRHIVEADNGSFECITVATFGSAVQVQSGPSLKALANTETSVVSVDHHTLSFFDLSSKSHTGSLKFSSPVKSLALSEDNKFLFLCNQEGKFYIIHLPTRQIKFERSLITDPLNENTNFCQILLHQKSNHVTVAIVVCEDGTIYCVNNINLALLSKTYAYTPNSKISVSKFKVSKSIKVSSAVLIGDDEDEDGTQFLLAGNALALCTVTITNIFTQFYLPLKEPFYITKLQASSDLSVIFALQTNGKIWELCPFTMMLLGVVDFNFHVKDFVLMEDLERNAKEFLTLSQTDDETATEVSLFNYEGMKNIFNIPLKGVASLVPVTTLVDEAFFLQGEYRNNQTQKIFLRTITKSHPEFRLQRLLRKRNYKEARTFAVQHNLDIQQVYKEEAADFVSHMSPWTSDVPRNDGKSDPDVSQLILLLEQISDIELVVKCCLKAIPPNILQTRELLTYGRKRIFDQGQNCPQLQTLVCNRIQLLDTFEIINEDLHPKNWLKFTKLDLLDVCFEYLQNNDLGCAAIVWLRHGSELLLKLPVDDIITMLDMIPTSSDTAPMLSFLSAFLPGILSSIPSMLSDIITWLHNKTRLLEWDCATQWPQVALDFCERSLQILQPPASERASDWLVHLHQQHSQPDSPLRQLQQTKSALVDLLYLQTHFGIVVSTNQYTQPDKTHVCHLLLKKTPASRMQELLNNLIRQIVLENNLDFEEIITSYIEITIGERSWWYHENIPCENEIITLIKFLKNIERTLSCIVLVLRAAPVPWSDKLVQLVEEFGNCGHHRTAEIKQEMNALVVKLVLKKYQMSEMFDSITSNTMMYEQLVRYILKHGNSDSLEDALKVVHSNPSHIVSVHSIYLEQLLKAGNYRTAHNHLKCLPVKLQLQVCQRMLIKIDLMLKEEWDYDELGCYIAFLEPTLTCLRDATDAGNTKGDLEIAASITAKITRNKYILRKLCFGSTFGTSHFYNQVTSANMFMNDSEKVQFYLEHVNQSLGLPSEVLLIKTKGIAQLLQLQELEALLLLVEAACTTSHFSLAVEALRSLNTMPRSVTKTEVNILIRLTKKWLPCFQEVASADPNFLPVLEQALCIFITHCNLDQAEELITLLNSLQFANLLATQKRNSHSVQDVVIPLVSVAQDPYHQWNFSTIYEDIPLNAETCCNVLESFLSSLWSAPNNTDEAKFLYAENEQAIKTEMSDNATINTDNACALIEWKGCKIPTSHENIEQKLLLTVNQLNSENNHLLALMLVCEIIPMRLLYPIQFGQHSATLLKCSQVLLRRVMAARKADLSLAIALLATASVEDSIDWLNHSIKRVRFECNHLTRTTQLAIDYSHLKKDFRHLDTLKRLHQIGMWGKRLQKMGISNKELMKEGGRENACSVLAMMIQDCPNIELTTIHQFCKDFEIRFDSAVLLCLENLIVTWQPEISVVKNKLGIEEIAVVNYEYVIRKAEFYVKTIFSEDCKRELELKLNSIWDKLNTYHYEMYLCLLRLKAMLNPNCDSIQSQILMFLIPYKRQVRPQMQEIEKWLRFHPDDTDLPSIAKWRLPYQLFLEESKNIIAMEVNLQNYQIWLQAPGALNCDPDHICVAAIQNSTSRDISLTKMEDWCVQARDEKLITDIAECVSHMTDMSLASAVLDHVSKRIPPGMDKLSIVDMSLQKIQLWCSEAQTSESKEMEKKVSKRLLLYSTYHVLHEQGLGRTEYIAMAENPSALIEALYRDPSILERGRGIAQHYPDIHNAVNMLGPLHNLNVQKIRHNLLENWLLSDMLSSGSLDDSFVDTSRVWQQFEQDIQAYDEAENDLLRARYLLETNKSEENVDYLAWLCFSPKSTCGARVKLRALNCIFWIIPTEQLSSRIGRDEVAIRDFAKTLFFLSELEQVQGQTCLSAQEFEDRNKASIVESLWRAHSQNPRALMLMCQICIYYNIYNPHVWANMLTRMQQLNLIKELEMILPKLNHVANMLCTPQFVAAWNKVLKTPFERVDDPLTKEQEEACAHSLLLLQGCPLLKDMDMPTIFKLCLEAKRFDLAAIILPLSSSSERVPLLRELLKVTTIEDLKQSFHKLRNYASLPIAQAQQIIENNADMILTLDNSFPHFSTPPAMLI